MSVSGTVALACSRAARPATQLRSLRNRREGGRSPRLGLLYSTVDLSAARRIVRLWLLVPSNPASTAAKSPPTRSLAHQPPFTSPVSPISGRAIAESWVFGLNRSYVLVFVTDDAEKFGERVTVPLSRWSDGRPGAFQIRPNRSSGAVS